MGKQSNDINNMYNYGKKIKNEKKTNENSNKKLKNDEKDDLMDVNATNTIS